jgi:hypothetical protein
MLTFIMNDITDSFNGMYEFIGKVLVNFIPEGIDMDVNKVCTGIKGCTPDLFRDFNSFEYLAGMTEQQLQQLVFKRGKFNFPISPFHPL